MQINPETLLFEGLTSSEREELLKWAERIILVGGFLPEDPPWITEWMRVAGYAPHQRLLVLSTVLPQRVLLSIVHALNTAQPWASLLED